MYLFCTSYTVAVYLQYACPCLRACGCVCTRRLGARGAGGALQGGLGEPSGEGSDAGVCQRRGREQLVPAADCGREVQVLQEDLGHSHEALVVHAPVIAPHDYLGIQRNKKMRAGLVCLRTGKQTATPDQPGGLCPEGSHRTRETAGRWDPDSSLLLWFSFWPNTRRSPARTPSRTLLQVKNKTRQDVTPGGGGGWRGEGGQWDLPRTWNVLGARFRGQPSGLVDLHLQLTPSVHNADVDIPCGGNGKSKHGARCWLRCNDGRAPAGGDTELRVWNSQRSPAC